MYSPWYADKMLFMGKRLFLVLAMSHSLQATFLFLAHCQGAALANLGFVICYAAVLQLTRERNIAKAIICFDLTVFAVCIYNVLSFGWGFGFQYYLLTILASCCIAGLRSKALFTFTAFGSALIYALLLFITKGNGYAPLQQPVFFDIQVERAAFVFNVLAAGSLIMIVMFAFMSNVKRSLRDQERINKSLENQAKLDPLTGLYNRWAFYEHISYLECSKQTCCLAILDLDFFKRINDGFGHSAGDLVLTHVAWELKNEFKANFVVRWGGEEFLIFAQNEDESGFKQRLNELIRRLADYGYHLNDTIVHVTASVGAVSSNFCAVSTVDDLIKAADLNLYFAKGNGRNQVIISKAKAQKT